MVELPDAVGPAVRRARAGGLRGLLRGAVASALADHERRGCFVVNATAERLPSDEATRRTVEGQLAWVEDTLTAALTRAREQGELRPDVDVVALARFVVTTFQGLQVMAKARPHAGVLSDAVEVAVTVIGAAAA